MATLRVEQGSPNRYGECKVYIRVHHNGEKKRIAMPFKAKATAFNNRGEIVDNIISLAVNKAIIEFQQKIIAAGFEINGLTCAEVVDLLLEDSKRKAREQQKKEEQSSFRLDFVQWIKDNSLDKRASGGRLYLSVATKLAEYAKSEGHSTLDINDMTKTFVDGFVDWLSESGLKQVTLARYLSVITACFSRAKEKYNDEDAGVVMVTRSPFANKKKWAVSASQKSDRHDNVLPPETIRAFFEYDNVPEPLNFARQVFLLSFGLCGMNAVDMIALEALKDNSLVEYSRAKVADRSRFCSISIPIPEQLADIHRQLLSASEGHVWCFYDKCHGSIDTFHCLLQRPLKQYVAAFVDYQSNRLSIPADEVRSRFGIPENLTFYGARHSWATIAANDCAIPIEVVDKALCHAPKTIAEKSYIKRDFADVRAANKKVMEYVFGQ